MRKLQLALLVLAMASMGWQSGTAKALAIKPICAIQGRGFSSPYAGQTLRARGVVFADLDQTSQKGFFMQAENCDEDPTTSDGIFIYLGERVDVVSTGDEVEVRGLVQEYYGMTEMRATAADVNVLSHGNPLPFPRELNPAFEEEAARRYFESLEGMSVQVGQARAVGPTDADDRTWLARADLGLEHVFYDDPLGVGEVICVDDNGLYEITPEMRVGEGVEMLSGALDYRLGEYCMELTTAPVVVPAQERQAAGPDVAPPLFSVATFNLHDLFDNIDNPVTEDDVLSGAEYQRRLQKRALAIHTALGEPTFIAVQEVESTEVLQALVGRPEVMSDYRVVLVEGVDTRGLDVALLYRADQAILIEYQAYQGCIRLVDGLEPDGNGDFDNPQNALTCDTDGDGVLDGNRLFSRPPLVAHMRLSRYELDVWLIVNHLKSKREDSATVQYTQPRRLEQARFVAVLAQEVLRAHPGATLVVAGDLNDYPDSQTMAALFSDGFADAWWKLPRADQYSYIYRGISQTLDYILFNPQWSVSPVAVRAAHINADYPYSWMGTQDALYRSSDHDPLRVDFGRNGGIIFLPLVRR